MTKNVFTVVFVAALVLAACVNAQNASGTTTTITARFNCSTLVAPAVDFYAPPAGCIMYEPEVKYCIGNYTTCETNARFNCTQILGGCTLKRNACLRKYVESSDAVNSNCTTWSTAFTNELLYLAAGGEYNASGLEVSCQAHVCRVEKNAEIQCTAANAMGACPDPSGNVFTRPPTSVPSTPAPGTKPTCNCNNRGYEWYRSSTNTCGCYCNWPWGGTFCEKCRDPTAVIINGKCTPCVKSQYATYFAASGSTFNVNVKLNTPNCATFLPITVSQSGAATKTFFSDYNNNLDVQIPTCNASQQVWRTYTYLSVRSSNFYRHLGSVRCVPAYTFPAASDAPNHMHLHFIERRPTSFAPALAMAKAMFAQSGKKIDVTFFDMNVVLKFNTGVDTFQQFQDKINAELQKGIQVDSWWWQVGYKSAPCSFFTPNNTLVNAKTAVDSAATFAFVLGDLRQCSGSSEAKIAFNTELGTLASQASIVWVGADPSAPAFATGITFAPYDEVKELFSALTQHFVKSRPVVCTGDLSFFPKEVAVLQRAKLYFNGACGIKACCVGSRCSTFVDTTGGRSTCFIPLTPSGSNFTVKVVNADGTEKIAPVGLNTVAPTRPPYYAYRWKSWKRVGNRWTIVPRDTMSVYRRNSWYSRGVVNSNRCCHVVGLSFNTFSVMGGLGEETCFPSYTRMTLPKPDPNLLPKQPLSLALQCFRPLIEETGDALETNDTAITTVTGKANPSNDKPANAEEQSTLSRDARIAAYVAKAKKLSEKKQKGAPQQFLRKTLRAARFESTTPREERACKTNEAPEIKGKCFYGWGKLAKDAGKYLRTMGFLNVTTDWYLSNAIVGDIVVFPGVVVTANGKATDHSSGYIAVKVADNGDSSDYASGWRHSKMPYSGVYEALAGDAGFTISSTNPPEIYRLGSGETLEFPQNEEVFVPIEGTADVVVNPTQWISNWEIFDKASANPSEYVDLVNAHYKCPATTNGAWPRQLWRMWALPFGSSDVSNCFNMVPTSARPFGVRCCYDNNNQYIDSWPSQVLIGRVWNFQWAKTIAETAEQVACINEGGQAASCLLYQESRPAAKFSTDVFATGSLWTPRRRWGGAFGDPHCTTYDGKQFECNFHGEALWTGCGDWKVHVVAEPVSEGAAATVITSFAVEYKSDVLTAFMNNNKTVNETQASEEGRTTRNFDIYLNGDAVIEDESGDYLTIRFDNNTVEIEDPSGNAVKATFLSKLISLQTAPSEKCFNATVGLCGNNNDDDTDDLLVHNTNVILPANTTGEKIYTDMVLSYLVTDPSKSLLPTDTFVAANTTFVPIFLNESLKANCPAACDGDLSCCFDSAVGGEEFVTMFTQAKKELAATNEGTVTRDHNFPPVFTTAALRYTINASDTGFTLTYVAADADNVKGLECNVCAKAGVDCSLADKDTATATLTVVGSPIGAMVIECNATDAKGAVGFATTNLLSEVATDAPAGPGGDTPSPTSSNTTGTAAAFSAATSKFLVAVVALATVLLF